MRRVFGLLLVWWLSAVPCGAATVTLAWNPSVDAVTGYRVQYGPMAGVWPTVLDVGNVTTTTLTLAPGVYFVTVTAYNAEGMTSGPSNEVQALVTDPCAFPLGSSSVSIFVTGKLQKTGSGGPGSRAYITFQAASPNSPVIFASVRANGVDVPDGLVVGSNLRAIGSLWFTIPQGPMTYSVFAQNAAGCSREQATGFSTP